jgi:hypothetical protein
MKDTSGWELIDYDAIRLQAAMASGLGVAFIFPLVGSNNRWHINRISVSHVAQAGQANVYADIRVLTAGDTINDPAPVSDLIPAITAYPGSPGYFVAAKEYPEGSLWVPEDCHLWVFCVSPNAVQGQTAEITVQYTHLARP